VQSGDGRRATGERFDMFVILSAAKDLLVQPR